MEEIIKIGEKIYKIKELTLEEGLNLNTNQNEKIATIEFAVKCLVEPIMTIEEFKKLPFREGLQIIKAINKLNGLSEDFQKSKEIN